MAHDDNKFTLWDYGAVAEHNKVLNTSQIGYIFWISIPPDINRYCELFQIDEIIPNTGEVDYLEYVERECRHPWLKIQSEMFNMSIGTHMYKFSFIDVQTDDITPMFISYTIQNDNPDKPYDYMKKYREAGGSCK